MAQNDLPWFKILVVDDKGKIFMGLQLQTGMVPGYFGHQRGLKLPQIDILP